MITVSIMMHIALIVLFARQGIHSDAGYAIAFMAAVAVSLCRLLAL